jgi:hypothetical protein
MSTESGQFVIADLLANAVEPWDNLTDQELASLNAADGDGSLPAPVVVAAYRNERGPVLIDGSQRLRWLASPPRNQEFISADEVRIDQDAVDEESARRAAVALRVNGVQASPQVRVALARRLQAQLGWSHATIAEVFKVSKPAVPAWLTQWPGADVPEVARGDGKTFPARGKRAMPEAGAGTVADALKALEDERQAALQRHPMIRQVKIDRHGSSDPGTWTVSVPRLSAGAIAQLAELLREQAADLISLADRLGQPKP